MNSKSLGFLKSVHEMDMLVYDMITENFQRLTAKLRVCLLFFFFREMALLKNARNVILPTEKKKGEKKTKDENKRRKNATGL